MDATFWLILMIVFLAMEASTVTLVSVWFAAGALAALAAAMCGAQLWLQLVLFFGVSGILLAALRPLARKYFKPRITKTNVDAVVGTQGYVTQDIDNISARGQVKLGAMEWSARSSDGTVIPKGTLVSVDKIEGVKAFVTPVKQPQHI